MPVILRPEDKEHCLAKALPIKAAQTLLVPYPTTLLTAYEVSSKVNSPAFNTPEVVPPV
jgi:putative SOS response-associated peptidase YedK